MYDFDLNLPFSLGINVDTIAFLLNLGIPIIYFTIFFFMLIKLKGMDKEAPFYTFMRSLVYFFFFYGLGAIYFVWYDFFYMDFTCPNPINILFGETPPPAEAAYLWQIGNLIQNIGLFIMLLQLRKKIFTGKFKQTLPVVWEIIGLSLMIFTLLNFFLDWKIYIPLISDVPFFWLEMNFLFNFTWSIALPLTYSSVWKNTPGKLKRYAFILFFCFIIYGISWGLRSRTAVWMLHAMFSWIPAISTPSQFTYEFIWILRGFSIVLNLSLVFYAYRKLLKEF